MPIESRVFGPDDRPLNTNLSRRLLDKVIIVLFSVVVFFVVAWSAIVWNAARDGELQNTIQDTKIHSIETKIDKMDLKLDRIFEKVK